MSFHSPVPRAKAKAKTTAKAAPLGAPKAGLAHKKKLEGVPKPSATNS